MLTVLYKMLYNSTYIIGYVTKNTYIDTYTVLYILECALKSGNASDYLEEKHLISEE
jgi:hypothetical protein